MGVWHESSSQAGPLDSRGAHCPLGLPAGAAVIDVWISGGLAGVVTVAVSGTACCGSVECVGVAWSVAAIPNVVGRCSCVADQWIVGAVDSRENTAFGVGESLQLPLGPGEPNLYFEYDFPAVGSALFPGLAEVLLVQAVQLNYCSSGVPEFSKHPVCLKYRVRNPGAVREALELALRQQPKTNEDVYYSYIEVLRGTGAAASEVEAACVQWRRLFPFSDRPDPLAVTDGASRP